MVPGYAPGLLQIPCASSTVSSRTSTWTSVSAFLNSDSQKSISSSSPSYSTILPSAVRTTAWKMPLPGSGGHGHHAAFLPT